MDKNEEKVLVVKTDILFPKGVWEGFREYKEEDILPLIKKNASYVKRKYCETDPSWQQIIPQICLLVGKKVFINQFPETSSEERLRRMWLIFLGGHVNNSDDNLESAITREFEEEINYKGKIIKKTFFGLVKLHDNPVNKVHTGLMYVFEGDSEEFESTGDTGTANGKFIPIKELNKHLDKMTYWSQLVAPYLIQKYS